VRLLELAQQAPLGQKVLQMHLVAQLAQGRWPVLVPPVAWHKWV